MNNNEPELISRIKEGEGLHLDFKHCISDSGKIARSLAAYANTDGGSLLIGVRDNGSIAGISSDEECYMIETASMLYTFPVVEYTTIMHKIQGKTVLEVAVAKSDKSPHYAPDVRGDMKVFVRCDDKNVLAPREYVKFMQLEKKAKSTTEIAYDDTIKLVINEISINGSVTKEFLTHFTGMPEHEIEDILTKLMLMNIISISIDEKSVKYIFNEEYKNQKR